MGRWITFMALLFALPGPAGAEQGDAERRAAEAFNRGTRLYEAEDFLAAAEAFEEANRIVPSASVHYNIARSYELAELPYLAAQHYRAFLDGRAGSRQRRRQVEQRLQELSEGLGWVNVQTVPPGATIRVNGRDRGLSPVLIALPRGAQEITAERDGASAHRSVEVREGEITVSLRLRRDMPDEAESPDEGEPRGEPPASAEAEPVEPPSGIGRLHHGFFWGTLALAVGSGAALAFVGTDLLRLEDEYSAKLADESTSDDELAALAERGQRYERATTALWVTTGVLFAAAALVAVFTDWGRLRRGRSSSRLRVAPTLGRGGEISIQF